jgi:chromosomal replication initiation ATPase DnaA|tara:strand:+ start:961 stop:1263 length:303 start_codon:yes stop_codon:yes gene_type:complete
MKKEIFDDYATAVAKRFHLTLDEMFTSSRRQDLVDARQMLYYLCMERPIRISYIQRFLETYNFKVTHSTIIHGYNKAKESMKNDTDVTNLINDILKSTNV